MCWKCDEKNEEQQREAKNPKVKEKEPKGRGLNVFVHLPETTKACGAIKK